MKTKVFNAHNKYMILKHGINEKNVAITCKLFGISRTTYYKWKKEYRENGMKGLELKEAKQPVMPNKVPREIENIIIEYSQEYPNDGPKRIYYELKSNGINIGESGVYNVLKRNGLSTKKLRQQYCLEKSKEKITSSNSIGELASINKIDSKYPGHAVIHGIDYVGTFKGIGRIYQYYLYDTYSKWIGVRIYNRKQDIDPWHYFDLKLVYLMKIFKLEIENLYVEKNKEYLPFFFKGKKYTNILEKNSINHRFIETNARENCNRTMDDKKNIFEERKEFDKYIYENLYSKIDDDFLIQSFADVEEELNKVIKHYNFENRITRGVNKGMVPSKVMLDQIIKNGVDIETLPLWIMTMVNEITKEVKDE